MNILKSKKGIALNQAFGAVLTLVLVAVLVIIAIFLFVVEGREGVRAWIFASFISSILGILLGIMGLLSSQWVTFDVLSIQ